MVTKFVRLSLLALAVVSMGCSSSGNSTASKGKKIKEFQNWPEGKSPVEIGNRVVERFLVTPHPNFSYPGNPSWITYPETVAWYGALTFAKETENKEMVEKLAQRFEPIYGEEARLIPHPGHVDNNVFGAVPLELYMQKKEQRYLDLGLMMADKQWEEPTGKNEKAKEYYAQGYSPQTRLWIDDMYMITAIQAQAYRATGDRKYIDRAAKEMVLYLDKLQKPNGLFYHAPEAPFYWGRGNGWMAAGMAELLRTLPEDSQYRPRIMEGYKKMMASLLQYQAESGMWRQLIDDAESWPETSSTGMFTFAMITGVKNGWLDKNTYAPAARKGWLALTTYLDENANLREVGEGTNVKNDRNHYLNRKRVTGDMHGQAPLLWCATALLR